MRNSTSSFLSSIRRHWNIAGFLFSVLLVAYLVVMVLTNYRAQANLQESLVELFRQDIAKRASSIGHFLDERKNDLRYLADAREIAVYFANKALGMSMEYGLGSSLVDMNTYFNSFVSDRRAGGDQIYTRIMLYDSTGAILADTWQSPEKERPAPPRETAPVGSPEEEAAVIVDESRMGQEIAIVFPFLFKGMYAGQLVAFLSSETLNNHFVKATSPTEKRTFSLAVGTTMLGLQESEQAVPRYRNFSLPLNMENGKFYPLFRTDNTQTKAKMVVLRLPVNTTPLSLIALFPETEVTGIASPWRIPLFLAILSLFVAGGTIIMFKATTNNIVLKTRLEEAAKREAEIAERNTQLAAEIEERIRVEQDLKLAKESADAANLAKSQFLANMSHEIRTPMNGILGMTELLFDTNLSETQKRFAEGVYHSSESLLHIINDILDLSKIEAGRIELEAVPFDAGKLVRGSCELFSPKAIQKGLTIGCHIAEEVPALLKGDEGRLGQILNNLLANAVKFTNAGSISVTVGIAEQSADTVLIHGEVKDSGIGIDPQLFPKIFDTFSQADSSTTRRFGGTGLGLAIVKHLTELMGGSVGVESEPGMGSTFWFTVRLAQQAAGTAELLEKPSEQTVETPLVSGARVLVVEDNPVNQALGIALLENLGCVASSAETGAKAIRELSRATYDLVLMDCHMPEMDGFEATRIIRERERERTTENQSAPEPHTIIIALTANALEGDRKQCLAAGMDDYLSKPITRKQLRSMLAKWLRKPGNVPAREEAPIPFVSPGDAEASPADTVSTSPAVSPLIETEYLDNIRALQTPDTPDLLSELIDTYFTSSTRLFESLRRAVGTGDAQGVLKAAHSMKSSSANLGALSLAERFKNLENLGRSNTMAGAAELLMKIEPEYAAVCDTMAAIRKERTEQENSSQRIGVRF